MPTPIIGLFSECGSETQFSLVMVLALELMEQGKRVLLVDADPVRAPFSGIVGAPVPSGVSFLGLLQNPQAKPMRVDCSKALGNPSALARGGCIELVPGRAEAEPADPSLLIRPPLQGARRFAALFDSLALAAQGFDVVLLLGAESRSILVTHLLAHCCHAALLIADNTARQVLWLAHTAREADALRGGLIPCTCVESRDNGEAVPEGVWQELWRTHPGLLPPHRKGEEGPERLLILQDSREDASRLAQAVLDLAQLCATEGALLPNDAPFLSLYKDDREQALAMFRTHIAPRQGTRTSAVASLLAVWEAPERRWEDVQQLAKYVVQKLRWEEPSTTAELLLPIYEALVHAAEQGPLASVHARCLIDLANLLAHIANCQQTQGYSPAALTSQVEALLLQARTLPRTPTDCARTAEVLAYHARLSGTATHYSLALADLQVYQATVSRAALLQRMVEVVSRFAHADASLWPIVLKFSDELLDLDALFAHHNAAIALTHMGRPWQAFDRLLDLATLDRETCRLAFADPDLKPLWRLGGSLDALPPTPQTKTR